MPGGKQHIKTRYNPKIEKGVFSRTTKQLEANALRDIAEIARQRNQARIERDRAISERNILLAASQPEGKQLALPLPHSNRLHATTPNTNMTVPALLALLLGTKALRRYSRSKKVKNVPGKITKQKPTETRKLNTILSKISELAQEYKLQQMKSAPIAPIVKHNHIQYTSKHKRSCVACAAKSK
jgi:hypothetical protein